MNVLRLLALSMLSFHLALVEAETFTVEDIEIIGAKKISVGTVFNYLPIKPGEQFDTEESAHVIKELYSTGFFDQVELLREQDSLIVKLHERPAIAEINIDGNKEVDDDAMKEALKQVGMSKGKIFNKLILDKMEQELRLLYYSLGKYGIKLDTEVRELEEGRVAIDINISEGEPARIRSINITGNAAYEEQDLLDEFDLESTEDGWFPSDKYSSVKLSGDMEKLKSYYLDRGYVNFNVDSKQVTITPDRKDINITVNVHEGDLYHINRVEVTGELIVPDTELLALVPFHAGDVFSRKMVTRVIRLMSKRLGEEGYAFANVNVVPDVNDDDKTVNLKYVIEPGHKVNVRFIRFHGNEKTRDLILRREMRQLESELFRASKIDRSKTRLQRLKYITNAEIKLKKVLGQPDQVDLDVTVSERFSGSFTLGAGFSEAQGAILNLGLSHDNIFGTGKTLGLTFDNTSSQQKYRLSYINPYYTPEGISRGFLFDYSETDAAEASISNYFLDKITFAIDFKVPLSEYNAIRYNLGVERNDVTISTSTADEIVDFIVENSNDYDSSSSRDSIGGDIYDNYFAAVSYSIDSRNRLIFPESGSLNSFAYEVFFGDLEYYKLKYRNQTAYPLTEDLTFAFKFRLGYGESYNTTSDLPFFEKFTAGGVRTVRGYDFNSLGPKDSKNQNFGGNFQVITNTELLIPVESLGSSETFRLGLYFDAGNVFEDPSAYETSELRTSVGLSAKWFSLIGPLEFSYAFPLNDEAGDDTRQFQFSLGAAF